jgi:hypothetical protein
MTFPLLWPARLSLAWKRVVCREPGGCFSWGASTIRIHVAGCAFSAKIAWFNPTPCAQFLAVCSRSKWSKHLTNSPFLALLAVVYSM